MGVAENVLEAGGLAYGVYLNELSIVILSDSTAITLLIRQRPLEV